MRRCVARRRHGSRGVPSLAALLLLASAIACGPGGSSVLPSHVPGPGSLVPTPTAEGPALEPAVAVTVTASVGATISASDAGLVVSVPAGALAANTAISVTQIGNMARGGIGPAYRLGPEGTTFAVPVTLTFKAPASYPPGTSMAGLGISYQDATGFWHSVGPVTRDATAKTISVTTTHFSDWTLTWQLEDAAAEGPISLVQTVGGWTNFIATGRASLFFLGSDSSDTSYVMTGTLTVPSTIAKADGSQCAPSPTTLTLPMGIAEIHGSQPPVFRWGIGAKWNVTCTSPGGAVTTDVLPALFDTMFINLTDCGGAYGANQVVTSTEVAGTYSSTCTSSSVHGSGYVTATWDLISCQPGLVCNTGVECQLGVTACNAGVESCVAAGPAPDGATCGPSGAYVCSAAQCVNPGDPTAGIIVTPTSGLTTTEAGGTATFTIVLGDQPTTDVTIGLSSSNTAEGTVSPASVTFTPASWNVAQTVTVTGVNDFVADGNQAYTIVTAPAVSSDPRYSGRDAADVQVTNLDDDVAGFVVTPTSGLVTTEAGGTATFTIALSSRPLADVSVSLTSSAVTEGTVSPAFVTFSSTTWNVPQTVTVTGVDDLFADGPQGYTIVTAPAVSADPAYSGMDPPDVSVTNLDNDVAAVIVSPTSGLVTTEAGGQATFTVVLGSKPTADVTIPLHSSMPTEGTVSPASLTFTAGNWNVAQTVTVTGVDDHVADGPQVYAIVTEPAVSLDPVYATTDAPDVAVTNLDNDAAGIAVTPTAGLVTTEAGGTATFTVVLTSQPTADVTIPLRSSNLGEGTVAPASLTFTSANWDVAQVVTVTGVNDFVVDGPQAYTIITDPAVSADAGYSGRDAADVSVSNLDDDVPGIFVSPTSGLVTSESGGAATFTIVLQSKPAANVTIPLSSSNTGEVTVSPASVTFSPDTWNVPQVVVVTGQDDLVMDGDQLVTIVTGAAVSTDLVYAGIDPADVTVTNQDNDVAGIVVSPTSGLQTTTAGGTAAFTIVLSSQPVLGSTVTISLSSSDDTAGTVAPAQVVFTPDDWNAAQTVTVTGGLAAGAYTVFTAPAQSGDPAYSGMDAADVAVTNAAP